MERDDGKISEHWEHDQTKQIAQGMAMIWLTDYIWMALWPAGGKLGWGDKTT